MKRHVYMFWFGNCGDFCGYNRDGKSLVMSINSNQSKENSENIDDWTTKGEKSQRNL
jgi:hypothetical protein